MAEPQGQCTSGQASQDPATHSPLSSRTQKQTQVASRVIGEDLCASPKGTGAFLKHTNHHGSPSTASLVSVPVSNAAAAAHAAGPPLPGPLPHNPFPADETELVSGPVSALPTTILQRVVSVRLSPVRPVNGLLAITFRFNYVARDCQQVFQKGVFCPLALPCVIPSSWSCKSPGPGHRPAQPGTPLTASERRLLDSTARTHTRAHLLFQDSLPLTCPLSAESEGGSAPGTSGIPSIAERRARR